MVRDHRRNKTHIMLIRSRESPGREKDSLSFQVLIPVTKWPVLDQRLKRSQYP